MQKSTYEIYKNVLNRYEKDKQKKKKVVKRCLSITACFIFVFSVSLSVGYMVFRKKALDSVTGSNFSNNVLTTQGETVSNTATVTQSKENAEVVTSKPQGTGSQEVLTTNLSEINSLYKTLTFSEEFFSEASIDKFIKSDGNIIYRLGGESQDFNYMIMISKNTDDFTENFLTESTVYNDCQVLYSSDFQNYKISSGDWFIQITLYVVKNIPSSEIFVLDKMFEN